MSEHEYDPIEHMGLDLDRDGAYLQVEGRDLVHVRDFDPETGKAKIVVWESVDSDSKMLFEGDVDVTAHLVRVKFEQSYEDGVENEHTLWVEAPHEDDSDLETWWEDIVFPLTGDGQHPGVPGYYTATVLVCDVNHDIVGQSKEWDG